MDNLKHFSHTRPMKTRRGYVITLLRDDGRTPVATCLPQPSRNGATTAAWVLRHDIRAAGI